MIAPQGISNSYLDVTNLPPFIIKDEVISLDPNGPNVTPPSNIIMLFCEIFLKFKQSKHIISIT
jgi:hypothetical protein